jgi:hypothetical protein
VFSYTYTYILIQRSHFQTVRHGQVVSHPHTLIVGYHGKIQYFVVALIFLASLIYVQQFEFSPQHIHIYVYFYFCIPACMSEPSHRIYTIRLISTKCTNKVLWSLDMHSVRVSVLISYRINSCIYVSTSKKSIFFIK